MRIEWQEKAKVELQKQLKYDDVIYIANIWDTRREPQRLTEEVY